jgi:hypothetical protein
MGSKIKAPEPRSYMGEMQSALNAQAGIQGNLINLERQYTPQWQQLQQQNLMGAMGNINALYGSAIPQSEALQNQMLASQGRVYGGVGAQARNAYNATLDPTTAGLYSTMAGQAAQGLASGRNLSDQEMRMAQGSARAAMAARGMQSGNQAIAAEVLNSYNLANAREDRARQFATNMYGIGAQNATQAMSMYGQPLMNQLGAVSATGLVGQAGGYNAGLGAKLFQPESQYNAALITANRQEQMQAQIANQQATAGMISAGIGAIGTMGGSLLGNTSLFGGKTAAGAVKATSMTPTTNIATSYGVPNMLPSSVPVSGNTSWNASNPFYR